MKKILSSLILIVTFPIRLLKRTRIDNFIGGVIFGALFSLLVNIVTIQIQEIIQKQRILEAVENEIAMNKILAGSVLESNQDKEKLSKKIPIDYFYTSPKYSSGIWFQSSEAVRYVVQLDQEVQIKLRSYYSGTIYVSNFLVDKANGIINKNMDFCLIPDTLKVKDDEKCIMWGEKVIEIENDAATYVYRESSGVLKVFHPTQDRLESRFLRLMMGSKSTKLLSGEKMNR